MTKTYVSSERLADLAHGGVPLPEEVIGIADELRLARGDAAEIERLRAALDETTTYMEGMELRAPFQEEWAGLAAKNRSLLNPESPEMKVKP